MLRFTLGHAWRRLRNGCVAIQSLHAPMMPGISRPHAVTPLRSCHTAAHWLCVIVRFARAHGRSHVWRSAWCIGMCRRLLPSGRVTCVPACDTSCQRSRRAPHWTSVMVSLQMHGYCSCTAVVFASAVYVCGVCTYTKGLLLLVARARIPAV